MLHINHCVLQCSSTNRDKSVKVVVLVSAILLLGCSHGAAKSAPQCRGEEYNPNFYICCGDYKYEKTTGAASCNIQPYNTLQEVVMKM
ncbi:hypothetical protein LSAT2_010942 [Lamellibrachia satsuma]|nr:hypothetical protein LSAT2_010942 [Lamellibrachia satsuma]